MEDIIRHLKEAFESNNFIKECNVAEQDFAHAAEMRDLGDMIKRCIVRAERIQAEDGVKKVDLDV